MKKSLLAFVLGCGICFLNSPTTLYAQASFPDSYYINIEFCYCGASVVKCRPEGLGNCETSSQIPCGEACEG
ncbi:hypothetical protein [Algoriphagus mannitolivorans]|uniref:hypothetical protein n=1 Tax=Algoriphagus mannitolivorans TaxID=226504 RepID=UPI0012F82FC7|nr:hypothetical protein [Algoriphagus mannitolivorans]